MIIFYARVSTKDQTVAHQLTHAREASFAIEKHFSDEGVSGVSVPLAERPGGLFCGRLL
jgi:putative DNA-invertase from lambdoid prophage Rac